MTTCDTCGAHNCKLRAGGYNICDDCHIKARLEYLQHLIVNERISYGELAELQSLAEHIPKDNMLLLEWAGVPES